MNDDKNKINYKINENDIINQKLKISAIKKQNIKWNEKVTRFLKWLFFFFWKKNGYGEKNKTNHN